MQEYSRKSPRGFVAHDWGDEVRRDPAFLHMERTSVSRTAEFCSCYQTNCAEGMVVPLP